MSANKIHSAHTHTDI